MNQILLPGPCTNTAHLPVSGIVSVVRPCQAFVAVILKHNFVEKPKLLTFWRSSTKRISVRSEPPIVLVA
jgi:hypothetical protein